MTPPVMNITFTDKARLDYRRQAKRRLRFWLPYRREAEDIYPASLLDQEDTVQHPPHHNSRKLSAVAASIKIYIMRKAAGRARWVFGNIRSQDQDRLVSSAKVSSPLDCISVLAAQDNKEHCIGAYKDGEAGNYELVSSLGWDSTFLQLEAKHTTKTVLNNEDIEEQRNPLALESSGHESSSRAQRSCRLDTDSDELCQIPTAASVATARDTHGHHAHTYRPAHEAYEREPARPVDRYVNSSMDELNAQSAYELSFDQWDDSDFLDSDASFLSSDATAVEEPNDVDVSTIWLSVVTEQID
ncbi:hypothetical protein BDW22DRAFT_464632 [Trametopsis cervina]|nr:hypothetical protein BDW22DRAFT_464632 [Trametopsis cervina]